jgi:hypothetical protein
MQVGMLQIIRLTMQYVILTFIFDSVDAGVAVGYSI